MYPNTSKRGEFFFNERIVPRIFFVITSLFCFSFTGSVGTAKKPSPKVAIVKEGERYRLYKDGKPYWIQGAGGYTYYEKLVENGGNSVRLWSTVGAKECMDKAQKLGLTVTLTLDIGHERKGFNYSDKQAVKKQLEEIKKQVLEFKDHPALLMWAVGNEIDQFAKNYEVWDAVRDIVKFIHQVDPDHPVTTMMAGVPAKHIKEMMKRCPEMDILSINAFKWIEPVRKDITAAGWTGPYLIGEWGASGYWESDKVPWGTFIEETSTQKAEVCAERYKKGIMDNYDRCLGSYVFYWGWKQARTHTLLSLFSEDGQEIGVIDILHKYWTGKERANKAHGYGMGLLKIKHYKKGIEHGLFIDRTKKGKPYSSFWYYRALTKYDNKDDAGCIADCNVALSIKKSADTYYMRGISRFNHTFLVQVRFLQFLRVAAAAPLHFQLKRYLVLFRYRNDLLQGRH